MGHDGNDANDAKRLILARRARFIAGALAGVAVACGGSTDEGKPQPCLEPVLDGGTGDGGGDDASTDGSTPQPCLSAISPDASDDAASDADADAEPQPCLAPPPGDQ